MERFKTTVKVNIQDLLQVFEGSGIGKMDNLTSADPLSYTTNRSQGASLANKMMNKETNLIAMQGNQVAEMWDQSRTNLVLISEVKNFKEVIIEQFLSEVCSKGDDRNTVLVDHLDHIR